MVEINWNIFKAKFFERETKTFESLSYQLFCFEHNQPYGIFRFKNQTGIEVEPISIENESIGFQAKYYDTKISDNKRDICDSLDKAKSKNPKLTRIYLYINQELSESSKKGLKEPKYKIEIEEHAKKLQLSLVWRVPSHFEIQLAKPENNYLCEFYFSNSLNIVDFIKSVNNHTEHILFSIQNNIKFKNTTIQIDRSQILQKLQEPTEEGQVIILNGDGGCGKTAIIKDLYQNVKEKIPLYVFKAIEFNVSNIHDIFNKYGKYTFDDFLDVHKNELNKIIVIDSAEALSDINDNHIVFKEFLSALLKNSWQIIFTTRNNYLDDLRFLFLQVYRIKFKSLYIENPSIKELTELSTINNFELPINPLLLKLLQNLFYLDEYLSNYNEFDNTTSYDYFKNVLWNKKIQNSSFTKNNIHILREKCFLSIAKERSESGQFYINPLNCNEEALSMLQKDEIIKYDSDNGGYFITHDIYEEWALAVIIERAYNNSESYDVFFLNIGNSLAIRRSFRKWLSQKIADNILSVDALISYAITDPNIDLFWKDEVLITILLSEYSSNFFEKFENFVLLNKFQVLKRIVFLIRIACKELDDVVNDLDEKNLKYLFTKPKGSGWNSVILLIYSNISSFDNNNLSFFLPVLIEWTKKNYTGETTRHAGLIALNLYEKIQHDDSELKYLNIEKKLVEIILYSAIEIKDELAVVFEEIKNNSNSNLDSPYIELVNSILTSTHENLIIISTLPIQVIELANKFWKNIEKTDHPYYSMHKDEYNYGIRNLGNSDYSPPSAYQTPVYQLLRCDLVSTLNFIIEFTNYAISNYYKESKFANNLEKIELKISENDTQTIFIGSEIWEMYRSGGSAPNILKSMHMALERYLLDISKNLPDAGLENLLRYILKKSQSGSIVAVVASITLANPDKLYNIAKILFASPEILLLDRLCAYSEHQNEWLSNIGFGLNNEDQYYRDERKESAKLPHRGNTLESLMISYQFFKNESISEQMADDRQQEIYSIIDDLYTRYPEKSNSSENHMVLRLLIAQLDRRKMEPIVEHKDDKLLINFNPQIASDLKQHSIDALKVAENFSRHTQLKLWSHYKFDKRNDQSNYDKYNNNPKLAIKEAKDILREAQNPKSEYPSLFSDEIPAYVCSAILKEFPDKVTENDLKFCKETLLKFAKNQLQDDYQYQIADGVEVAISALPHVVSLFPETLPEVKLILLLTLLDNTAIGNYKQVCDYAIQTINGDLKIMHGDFCEEFIISYLELKPLLDKLIKSEPPKFNSRNNFIEIFTKKHAKEIKKIQKEKNKLENFSPENYSLEILELTFRLIATDTKNEKLLNFVEKILPHLADKFLKKDSELTINYSFRSNFFKRFAEFILLRDVTNISKFVTPFADKLSGNRESVQFLEQFIFVEDKLNSYEPFWAMWNNIYKNIIPHCIKNSGHYTEDLLKTYMLAWSYWNSNAIDWHSLRDREKLFYQRITVDLGHSAITLYSISKILNSIASDFLNEGMMWISQMISLNSYSNFNRLESDTIIYLENVVRKFVYLKRENIKKDPKIKKQVLIVLNFLIERTSVNAYLLREDIL